MAAPLASVMDIASQTHAKATSASTPTDTSAGAASVVDDGAGAAFVDTQSAATATGTAGYEDYSAATQFVVGATSITVFRSVQDLPFAPNGIGQAIRSSQDRATSPNGSAVRASQSQASLPGADGAIPLPGTLVLLLAGGLALLLGSTRRMR
jgi:hypothetical protein